MKPNRIEQMKFKKYKKGQKMAGIYLGLSQSAGENMHVASAYEIYADVFDKGKYYQVPNIVSMNKGSGKLLDFLITLKRSLDKPVFFCTITNQGMYKYLCQSRIGIVEYQGKKPKFYSVKPTVGYALIEIKK